MTSVRGDLGDLPDSPPARTAEAIEGTGKVEGFEPFFRLHFPALIRILSVGSDDITDAVQEAFVQAHIHWATVSTFDDPVAWTRLVAVRRIVDMHRRRRRHQRVVTLLSSAEVLSTEPDPAHPSLFE